MDPVVDVCIVGGGMAGLGAALEVARRRPRARILVLEASDRWGGAVYTERDAAGRTWEAGAGRVERRHRRVHALIQRYGLTAIPVQVRERTLRSRRHAEEGSTLAELTARLLEAADRTPARTLHDVPFGDFATDVLGTEAADRMQTLLGYDAEFTWAQAAETVRSLRTTFAPDASYVVCPEGLGRVVEGMVEELGRFGRRVELRRKTRVEHLARGENGVWRVTPASGPAITARRLLLAVPPRVLVQNGWGSPRLHQLLQTSLRPVPLVRVYARFARPWTLPRVVGDGLARQVIPVRPDQGLVMVAYTDADRAEMWMQTPATELRDQVLQGLQEMYGAAAVRRLGPPRWIKAYPWTDAVHVWRPGSSFFRLRRRILALAAESGFALAGEAYSLHHGWMEGALHSAEEAVQTLFS